MRDCAIVWSSAKTVSQAMQILEGPDRKPARAPEEVVQSVLGGPKQGSFYMDLPDTASVAFSIAALA